MKNRCIFFVFISVSTLLNANNPPLDTALKAMIERSQRAAASHTARAQSLTCLPAQQHQIVEQAVYRAFYVLALSHINPGAAASYVASQLNSFQLTHMCRQLHHDPKNPLHTALENARVLATTQEILVGLEPIVASLVAQMRP